MIHIIYEDYQKKELTLSINSFNQPEELTGPKAWIRMIMYLVDLNPEDDPNDPEAGIGISQYEFADADDAADEIEDKIISQVHQYFPDIPLASVEVTTSELNDGQTVMMLTILFNPDDSDLNTAPVAVVALANSTSGLKYEVSIQ